MENNQRFYAYEINNRTDMELTTAPVDRGWMDGSNERFAYRCLPLNMANKAGWLIHCPVTFTAVWKGGNEKKNVEILGLPGATGAGPKADPRISSHFGSGVVTFAIPFLFQTPRGINLWVKGPSNYTKDGIQALEGIVETDWLPATFTMNWRITRAHHPIRFEKGEPICMLVPIPRGLAEGLEPIRKPLKDEPEKEKAYKDWVESRKGFLNDLAKREPEAVSQGWQKDYVKGVTASGEKAPEHQTKITLAEFRREGSKPPRRS